MEAAQRHEDTIRVGALEIHPSEGLALADGAALTLSVREFGLLVALARSGGGIVRREDLYRRRLGRTPARRRPLDRRVRPQAASEARAGAAGASVHPHARRL